MNMNFRKNMSILSTLSDDHYQGRISFAEYRSKRSLLLALIDEDLNGIKVMEVIEENKEEVSVSFMDKALSFLKTDQQQDG